MGLLRLRDLPAVEPGQSHTEETEQGAQLPQHAVLSPPPLLPALPPRDLADLLGVPGGEARLHTGQDGGGRTTRHL